MRRLRKEILVYARERPTKEWIEGAEKEEKRN